MVLKTGCVVDGKICMSQRKYQENCNRTGKKDVSHHKNIAYQKKKQTK